MTIAAEPHSTAVAPIPPTPRADLDAATATLRAHARAWTALQVHARIGLIEELIRGFVRVADRWTAACVQAEGLDPVHGVAEEALVGPYFVLRNLRLLRLTLQDIEKHGRPRIPGAVRTSPTARCRRASSPRTSGTGSSTRASPRMSGWSPG